MWLILVLASTAAATVSAVIFNLISDVIGGIWVSVIEEETARPAPREGAAKTLPTSPPTVSPSGQPATKPKTTNANEAPRSGPKRRRPDQRKAPPAGSQPASGKR